MNKETDINACAKTYLDQNWSIIPLRHKDKRATLRWQEFQYRRATQEDIDSWLSRWPDMNLGVVTGIVSRLVIMDINPTHGGDDSLFDLEQSYGSLPRTVEAITGGGGHHLYFQHPGGVVHNRVGFAPGIDIRGDGGYVVAPPSLHVSGVRYSWAPGHAPGETTIAPLPDWVVERLTGEDRRAGHTKEYWRKLVQEGVSHDQAADALGSLSGHLLWHGVDPDVVLEMMLCWNRVRCKPPLDDEEIIDAVQNISRTKARG